MPKRIDRRAVLSASLALLLLLGTGSASISGPAAASLPGEGRGGAAGKDREKILATLEGRMSDDRTVERMREKLDYIAGRRLRLAAALCERIADDRDSAGADIALSLVTALIILA